MIRFACPACGKHLKIADRGAGLKVPCPGCGQRLLVPSPATPAGRDKTALGAPLPPGERSTPAAAAPAEPAAKWPAGTVPATCPGCGRVIPLQPHELSWIIECPRCSTWFDPSEDYGPLISCPACGRALAKEAVSCPGCGAPNRWVHPEIVRFYNSIRQFHFPNLIQCNYEKYVLTGVDQRFSQNAQDIAALTNSFGVLAPLNIGGLAMIAGVHFGRIQVQEWARKRIKAFRIDFAYSPPAWSSTDDAYWSAVMDFFKLPKSGRQEGAS
jgi:DNA-directed RNA polymerase subunit RPC12/RpoP